ncbi:MAG TPA: hypothetical protein VF054_08940 [Micromonosporaceae bacterium]
MAREDLVVIDYTNYRGERGERLIRPDRIWFGKTDWHPESQWLLDAEDVDRGVKRTFALADVHSWKPAQPGDRTD